jgi:hypothetical protein
VPKISPEERSKVLVMLISWGQIMEKIHGFSRTADEALVKGTATMGVEETTNNILKLIYEISKLQEQTNDYSWWPHFEYEYTINTLTKLIEELNELYVREGKLMNLSIHYLGSSPSKYFPIPKVRDIESATKALLRPMENMKKLIYEIAEKYKISGQEWQSALKNN